MVLMLGSACALVQDMWEERIDTVLRETSSMAFFLRFLFTVGLCDWTDVIGRLGTGRHDSHQVYPSLF
jgi:hypothetical protein